LHIDGKQDLVITKNYIAFPPQALFKLPCRFLLQMDDGTFAATEEQAGVINKKYAITPLTSDFNNDGYPDLIYINLDGKAKAFINKGGNTPYIKVQLADKPKFIGATISLISDSHTQTNYNIIGEGLCSEQSNIMIFGIEETHFKNTLIITDINGNLQIIKNLKNNITIIIQ
jgi:hypothetical protein